MWLVRFSRTSHDTRPERHAPQQGPARGVARRAALEKHLETRARAFLTNDYYESDVAWMELDASIEPTIGPYETYNDELFGYKAAFEAYINLRDEKETARLKYFADHLQEVENNLPIDPRYRNPKLGAAYINRAHAYQSKGNNEAATADLKRASDTRIDLTSAMTVDGFRLDAVGHFFESGDTVRNASANHPWLRDYEAAIKRMAPNAFTVGEVTLSVNTRSPAPCCTFCVSSAAVSTSTKSLQVRMSLTLRITCERSGSYKSKIAACVKASLAPRLAG